MMSLWCGCVQHLGINAGNPGEVVFMEGGETLVQWRKSFFSQYGVNFGSGLWIAIFELDDVYL